MKVKYNIQISLLQKNIVFADLINGDYCNFSNRNFHKLIFYIDNKNVNSYNRKMNELRYIYDFFFKNKILA